MGRSVSFRLALIILLAVSITWSYSLYTALADRRQEISEIKNEALRLARAASLFQDEVTDQTRATLWAVASMPVVRNGDWKTCHEFIAAELQTRPIYTNLAVVTRDGTVVCSAIPASKPVNAADRLYFVRAVATRSFSMGEYQVGRITGKPAINFALPVLDDTGAVADVVVAALDVEWFDHLAQELQLPPGSAFEVFSGDGTIVAGYPDVRRWTGRKVPYLDAARSVLTHGATTVERPGFDGVRRVYGIMRLSVAPAFADMYVGVGIPTAPALAGVHQSFVRSLVWAGCASVFALLLGLAGTVVYVQRPLDALTEAARRLAAGDFTARAGSAVPSGELREVIAGFDEMAVSLERRTEELRVLAAENAALYTRYRSLFDAVPVGLYRTTFDGRFAEVNPAFARMLGYPDTNELKNINAVTLYADPERRQAYRARLEQDGAVADFEIEFKRYDGSTLWAEASARTTNDASTGITHIEGAIVDTTGRKRALTRLAALNDILVSAAQANDLQAFLRMIVDRILAALDTSQGSAWFGTTAHAGRHESPTFESEVVAAAVAAGLQPTQVEAVDDWERPGDVTIAPLAPVMLRHGLRASLTAPLLVDGQPTGGVSVETPHPRVWSAEEKAFVETIGRQIGVVAERLRLLDAVKARARDMEALQRSAQHMAETLDLQRLADDAVRSCVETVGVEVAWIARIETGAPLRCLACFPTDTTLPASVIDGWAASGIAEQFTGQLATGDPVIVQDLDAQTGPSVPWRAARKKLGLRSGAVLPLLSRGKLFGALAVYSQQPDFFTPARMEFLRTYAHQLATALENARLYDETVRRTSELRALREVDQAISGSLELGVSLNLVLNKALTVLQVDAGCVLLFNTALRTLEHAADQGFQTTVLRDIRIRFGEGLAGRAALERRRLAIEDLKAAPNALVMLQLPGGQSEDFTASYAVPLVAKGHLLGVLQVFFRRPARPTQEWLAFLDTLAGQTAIAISDARQFQALQRSNDDLVLAYDTTLESWARALELRDKETEGHTQRVTDLTMRLATKLRVPEHELVQIRRGALLHDIGKIAVSDTILRKPGVLTDEERCIMQQHPVVAHRLLTSIPYLRQAVDIPYCHHERWDGSGYPRGLKGEEIPIAARIFSVTDVWDALRSQRPYRAPLSAREAETYLKTHAGTQFDPAIVEMFLELVHEEAPTI